eukprot:COSAG01_NODE_1905_length_8940_cov_19.008936_6_plen_130_part_00
MASPVGMQPLSGALPCVPSRASPPNAAAATAAELNRMELAVMTVAVHSENVVTAEGVEITAKGLTQVRIDPGMADDQADAMIDARNEDIEHKVEEIIRQKTLYNKSRGEDEQVKVSKAGQQTPAHCQTV